ncbi:MAG: DUF2157 domain-containing protein [Sphingobium sp.]
MSDRKLKAWQQAGLIDAETAARIAGWEAAHSRPLGIWALVGLGALAIGLGLVSLVATNWDAIPGAVRLGIHFALMAGLALLIWIAPKQSDANDRFHDGLLFIAAVLGLTFFGHIGQVYQTSSPLWQPLLAWLVIFSPLLLLFGRGWPVAGLWYVALLGTGWYHAEDYGGRWTLLGQHVQPAYPVLYWGLIASLPMVVAAMAAAMRARSARPDFWRLLEQLAIATILAGVSIVAIISVWDRPDSAYLGSFAIQSLFMLGAAVAIWAARRTRSGQATAAILCVAAVVHLGVALLVQAGGREGAWIGALSFIALWSAVAYGSLFARWRRMFQGAVGLIAVRIIILSFELGDDLLGSGISLILSGLVAIGVAWVAVRVSRRYAPEKTG